MCYNRVKGGNNMLFVFGIVLCVLSVLGVILSVISDLSDNDCSLVSSFMGIVFVAGIFIVLYCCGVIK
jgi:hypothetical protein